MAGVNPESDGPEPVRARRATPSELVVVRDLIAAPLALRSERIRASGLPRRTYQTTARRAAARRWVLPRYLPSPELTGRPVALALLFTRAKGGEDPLLRDLARNPATSVCWGMPRGVFALLFLPERSTADRSLDRWKRSGAYEDVERVAVDVTDDGIPTYFDFEGEWARYGGLEGTLGYPQRFRPTLAATHGSPRVAAETSEARTVAAMSQRAFEHPEEEVYGPSPLRGWARAWSERRALERGGAEARTFLDPFQIARSVSDFATSITFVTGSLRPGASPDSFAQALTQDARAHPFLFLSDGRDLLLAFLAAGPSTRLAPSPPPARSVRAVVDELLEHCTVRREPITEAEATVHHRYEPLLGPPRPVELVAG